MRDVVIIGGGLSGLAAAYTLEKQNIAYTIVEVKRRLGGSIQTIKEDGFLIDAGVFAIQPPAENIVTEFSLEDDLFQLDSKSVAFKAGTQVIIDKLAAKITAPRMMRMAVSTIGDLEKPGKLALCFENGLVLNAKSIIVAIPARYAERLFYTYIPPVADLLREFHYDSIVRISAGYRAEDVPDVIPALPDVGYVFTHQTSQPERVPEGHTLIQKGIRMIPSHITPEAITAAIQGDTLLQADPVMIRRDYNPDADPLSCFEDEHPERVKAIRGHLPENIALIGGDYVLYPPVHRGVQNLTKRVQQGFDAANQMIKYLNK